MLKYRAISTITATLTFTLFLLLLLVPEIVFELFQIQGNESSYFISRRAAMLFLGLAALSWFGRNASNSESRQAICVGLSISMLALAVLGILEYVRGFVGIGIFVAIITEASLGVTYYVIWNNNRNT